MKKYFNFLLTFLSSRSTGLLLGLILYQFKSENDWATYAIFLTYVGLFKNVTLNFTSNLGHEGLRARTLIEYEQLFACIAGIIIVLQLISFPIIYYIFKDPIVIISFLYTLVISLQSLIQNYFRYRLDYFNYGSTSLKFTYSGLIALAALWFYNIQIYLYILTLINILILLRYHELILNLGQKISISFLVENIKKLAFSSLKLFLIRLPDSYFVVYFVLIEKNLLNDTEIAVLVYFIALASVDRFPILTPRIQENMDLIKSSDVDNGKITEIDLSRQFWFFTLLMCSYFVIESIYITFVATPMLELLPLTPFLFGYVLLIIWRYNANAFIELHENIFLKILPSALSIIIHLILFFYHYTDSLTRLIIGAYSYHMLYFLIFYWKYAYSRRSNLKFISLSFTFLIFVYFSTKLISIYKYYPFFFLFISAILAFTLRKDLLKKINI